MTARRPAQKRRPGPGGPVLPLDPEALQARMAAFLRGGGAVDLADWLAMPEALQAALERAGTEVRAELAVAIATSLKSEEGLREVAGLVGRGRPVDADLVTRALDGAARLLRRVP